MRLAFWRPREAPKPAQAAIMGQFSLNAALAGNSGRSLAITGYIFEGESRESLEARLDLLQEITERQRIRCEIPELEAKRDQMIKALDQAREVLAGMADKEKAGDKLSSQERMNMRNLQTNIQKTSEEIDKGTAAIRDAKLKAGVR